MSSGTISSEELLKVLMACSPVSVNTESVAFIIQQVLHHLPRDFRTCISLRMCIHDSKDYVWVTVYVVLTGTLMLCGKLDRRIRTETVWYPSTSSWMCVALPLVKRPAPSGKIDWRPVPSFSLGRGVRITHMPCTSSGSDKTAVPILFPPFPEAKHGTWYTSPDTSKHQETLWTQTR